MAAQLPLCNSPTPMEPQEKKVADPRPPSNYADLISALPLEEGWAPVRTRKFQGFWIPEPVLPGIMDMQQNFKARPDDLFVLSYPKSGTTWLKALTYAIMTRTQYPFDHHPLLGQNPHDCVPFMDRTYAKGQASELDAMPSPRILNTHLPYPLLPDSIKSLCCKVIYVCRDPKDVLVSRWYFSNRMRLQSMEPIPFTKAFEMFCEGSCPYGSVWEHVLEYWEESQRRPEKVLFLKYEEILEDPLRSVLRLAEFMGCPFSPEEEKEGVVEEVIKLCSFDKLKSLEVNKTGKLHPDFPLTNDSYFRKGEAGDWRNHMSPEMARKLDRITEQKLEGSGLTLGGVAVEASAAINGDDQALF
ncbi:flavonol 3-sulfotransferase-like [Phoenix dactylifera]|uniref:Sulfotransferase n=1 Tax=Phoenix dactylifera TaxID=42345 RepID=A0A8B8ZQ80_PHODC|nr:flavonol 3-sulfotransferase-like [Phoenix dactylifera]XP_038975497.1 flavonol 3-sulfotransferase-like [Phoenix dactylifera]